MLHNIFSRKISWSKLIFYFVLISLVVSLFYFAIQLYLITPETHLAYERTYSDYVLIILQCLTGIVAMFLPSILAKRMRFDVPASFSITYTIFIYCAIYLGEVRSFYYLIPIWDSILHTFSGAALGVFGLFVVDLLSRERKHKVHLSPFFVSFFAFCFAVTVGVLWEIYEFTADGLFGLNMQKFITESGEVLVGRQALTDTMKDLIVDVSAAFVVTLGYYLNTKRKLKIQKGKTSKGEGA